MKNILILSKISSKKYGDSTRPYYLGQYLSSYYKIIQACKINKVEKRVNYIDMLQNLSFSNPLKLLKVINLLNNKIKEEDIEILYTHQLLLSFIGVFIKKKNPNLPFISDFHTSAYYELLNEPKKGLKQQLKRVFIRLIEKHVARKSDIIITVSTETKKLLMDYYLVSEEKIKIVKNGTNITSVYQIKEAIDLNLESYGIKKAEHVLCVFPNPRDGFISNDLALDFLIEIAKNIENRNPKIRFLVLGGGLIPNNYPKNLIFTGYVNDYNKWLNIADVCIATYPLKAVCGGVRNKICDYLAVGKPIIATSESMRGFDDLKKGEHYYECNTVASFSETLCHFQENEVKNNAMKKSNLEKRFVYNWEKRAEELHLIFRKTIHV